MSDDNNYNKKEQLTTVSSSSRYRILSLMDNFIEQIFQIRKTLFGVSISALVLAPIAIGLSVFLLQHPSFFAILDIENEFGDVLAVLLGTIIVISSIWLVTGIRQYRLISSWKKTDMEIISEKNKKWIERLRHNIVVVKIVVILVVVVVIVDCYFFR